MLRKVLRAAAALCALAPTMSVHAGGELQAPATAQQTVSQAYATAASRPTVPPPGPYSYRFCLPYPHPGPGSCPGYLHSGMTHYAPGGWVYPGYAYAGYGASGYGPGPVLTGSIIGLAVGAHLF